MNERRREVWGLKCMTGKGTIVSRGKKESGNE